jgi:hypothetical protein
MAEEEETYDNGSTEDISVRIQFFFLCVAISLLADAWK